MQKLLENQKIKRVLYSFVGRTGKPKKFVNLSIDFKQHRNYLKRAPAEIKKNVFDYEKYMEVHLSAFAYAREQGFVISDKNGLYHLTHTGKLLFYQLKREDAKNNYEII